MFVEIFFKALIIAVPVIAVIILLYNTGRALTLRIKFYKNLQNSCDKNGINFRKTRTFLSTFFMHSSKPDLVVETQDTEYLIRFITCRSKGRNYHFPSPEFYVSSLYSTHVMSGLGLHSLASFRHLPSMNELSSEKESVQVLLFNPSPREITYVDQDKAQKALATNGTRYEGILFCNAQGFLDLLPKIRRHR